MTISDLSKYGYTSSELQNMTVMQLQALLQRELTREATKDEVKTFEIRRLDLRHEQFKQMLASSALACLKTLSTNARV